MTGRDVRWRSAGALLATIAGAAALLTDSVPLVLILFLIVLLGFTLTINGKRAAIAVRAERRGHRHTAEVIHAMRARRHDRRDEGGRWPSARNGDSL